MREEFIQHVQERLVPLLNHVPGFRAFTPVEVGDNNVTLISTFHTLADAQAPSLLMRGWIVENADFIQEVTKFSAGQLRVQNEPVRLSSTDYEELLKALSNPAYNSPVSMGPLCVIHTRRGRSLPFSQVGILPEAMYSCFFEGVPLSCSVVW